MMMMEDFIKMRYSTFTYKPKEGTKSSYILTDGKDGILPKVIGIGHFKTIRSNDPNRWQHQQIKAYYRKYEQGKFKGLNKGDTIHSTIYPIPNNSTFLGYAILDERHRIYDLLIFQICGDGTYLIHYFIGMARPELMKLALDYVRKSLKK